MDFARLCRDICLWAVFLDAVWLLGLSFYWPRSQNGYRTGGLAMFFGCSGLASLVGLYVYPVIDGPAGSQLSYAHGAIYMLLRTMLWLGLTVAVLEAGANRIVREAYWRIIVAVAAAAGLVEATRTALVDSRRTADIFHGWLTLGYLFGVFVLALVWLIPLVRQEHLLRDHRDPICLMLFGIALARLGPESMRWARYDSIFFDLAELAIKVWALGMYRGPPAKAHVAIVPGPKPVNHVAWPRLSAIATRIAGVAVRRRHTAVGVGARAVRREGGHAPDHRRAEQNGEAQHVG